MADLIGGLIVWSIFGFAFFLIILPNNKRFLDAPCWAAWLMVLLSGPLVCVLVAFGGLCALIQHLIKKYRKRKACLKKPTTF